jgi:hypothetical protein
MVIGHIGAIDEMANDFGGVDFFGGACVHDISRMQRLLD